MTRTLPLWYAKEQALFENLVKEHPRLEATRIPGGYVVFSCYCIYFVNRVAKSNDLHLIYTVFPRQEHLTTVHQSQLENVRNSGESPV